jgi:FkbM family methyltransferase
MLRIVNQVLGPAGLKLERVGRGGASASEFYSPPPTCQIPELADLYRLFLGARHEGLFVEVGAYDGVSFSNSSCLADAGWSGILIEPIPAFADLCRERYRGNQRIEVVHCAAGAEQREIEISVAGPFTTTNADVMKSYATIDWAKRAVSQTSKIRVQQRTLDAILADSPFRDRPIDVLIVDVEGAEEAVFAGFSLSTRAPKMIIVELSHTHPDLHAISADDAHLQRSIERAGYEVVYKDKINTVLLNGRVGATSRAQ